MGVGVDGKIVSIEKSDNPVELFTWYAPIFPDLHRKPKPDKRFGVV